MAKQTFFRDNFALTEYIVSVDVCSVTYFVVNDQGDVSTNQDDAHRMHHGGAVWMSERVLSTEPTTILEAPSTLVTDEQLDALVVGETDPNPDYDNEKWVDEDPCLDCQARRLVTHPVIVVPANTTEIYSTNTLAFEE